MSALNENSNSITTSNEEAVPIHFTKKQARNAQRIENSQAIIHKLKKSLNKKNVEELHEELKDHLRALKIPEIHGHENLSRIEESLEELSEHKYLQIGKKKPSKKEIENEKIIKMIMGVYQPKPKKVTTFRLNKSGKVVFSKPKSQTKKKRKN
jgi:hypothetical protein